MPSRTLAYFFDGTFQKLIEFFTHKQEFITHRHAASNLTRLPKGPEINFPSHLDAHRYRMMSGSVSDRRALATFCRRSHRPIFQHAINSHSSMDELRLGFEVQSEIICMHVCLRQFMSPLSQQSLMR